VGVKRAFDLDLHPADRIDRGGGCGLRLLPGAGRLRGDVSRGFGILPRELLEPLPHLDDLGHDRQGDFVAAPGADVEAGGKLHACEVRLGNSGRRQRSPHRAAALRAGHEADVGHLGVERRAQRRLVVFAVRRDDQKAERGHALGQCVETRPSRPFEQLVDARRRRARLARRIHHAHVVVHRVAEVGEGPGDGQRPHDQQTWPRVVRFDEDVQGASAEAGHRHRHDAVEVGGVEPERAAFRAVLAAFPFRRQAHQPAPVFRQRRQRLADHGRLRAASADPAVHHAVERDDRAVTRLSGGRLFGAHDDGRGERATRPRQLARRLEEVIEHGSGSAAPPTRSPPPRAAPSRCVRGSSGSRRGARRGATSRRPPR